MLRYSDYKNLPVAVEDSTRGGSTYIVDGRPVCFAFTKGHYRALEAISYPGNKDLENVNIEHVKQMEQAGNVQLVWDGDVLEGLAVYGADGELIGEIASRCSHQAGWGTEHPGTGRCKFHGGSAGRRPIHGRQSHILRQDLQDKINEYIEQGIPALLDLSRELATQKALLEHMLEYYASEDVTSEDLALVAPALMKSAEMIGSMAERINRMQNSTALTANQVLYLQVTVSDILMKYIQDPTDRELAAKELAARTSGRTDVTGYLSKSIQVSTMPGEVTL